MNKTDHFRLCLLYAFNYGVKPSEAAHGIWDLYGEGVLSQSITPHHTSKVGILISRVFYTPIDQMSLIKSN